MRVNKRQGNYYREFPVQTPLSNYPKNRENQAQRTINQLKQSIGSIQKMIQKSQRLLYKTRPLQPREVRSDSVQLRFRTESKQKYDKELSKYDYSKLNQLSQTTITKNNKTKQTSYLMPKDILSPKSKISVVQSQRPHLYIETQNLNNSRDSYRNERPNIFIYDSKSPASAITRQRQTQQSFADSLQNPFNFAQKLKTEGFNDSYEGVFQGQSLQGYSSIERNNKSLQKKRVQIPFKKILLKGKKNNNLNLNHMKTFSELQQYFQNQKHSPSRKIQNLKKGKGKYSYPAPNPHQPSVNHIPNNYTTNPSEKVTSGIKVFSQKGCQKFGKQNSKSQLDHFVEKVRKFGFVQRYLTYNQIGCIHQYLKRSQIPEHKWPLYVVDKVYEKMQTISSKKV